MRNAIARELELSAIALRLASLERVGASEANLNEAVYEVVVKNTDADKDTLANIREMMKETDQFWSDMIGEIPRLSGECEAKLAAEDFDGVRMCYDHLLEAADGAIEAVGSNILDWYSNVWNHPPGYKPPKKLVVPVAGQVADKDLEALIKKVAPGAAKAKAEADKAAKSKDKKPGKLNSRAWQLLEILDKLEPSLTKEEAADRLNALSKADVKKFDALWLKWKNYRAKEESEAFIAMPAKGKTEHYRGLDEMAAQVLKEIPALKGK
jgi:hypothetical protein